MSSWSRMAWSWPLGIGAPSKAGLFAGFVTANQLSKSGSAAGAFWRGRLARLLQMETAIALVSLPWGYIIHMFADCIGCTLLIPNS